MTKNCLICNRSISPFIDFGSMPLGNGFLSGNERHEYFYNLSVAFCQNCHMVQLMEQPSREDMFHDHYAFYSSTSRGMSNHFEEFAKDVRRKHNPSFVVEIGSNDGIMLRHFKDIGHLGVEPSKNVAQVAIDNEINTVSCFFDEKVADRIISVYGRADVVLAANVMCHISDLHSVIRGIKKLLKPGGVFIFEDPYLGYILQKTSYDQIYDEHVFYFTVGSLAYLFESHGMEIINVEPQDVHGGSMRYTVANKGQHEQSAEVSGTISDEYVGGLYKPYTYQNFRLAIESSRDKLVSLLLSLKGKGVVGYGATSKSTTVLNYCNIGPDLIECIYDTTPIKQGKFSPGMRIPIRPYKEFLANPPDYTVLFAWNHAQEIMAKEKDYKGKWIVYVPEVKIL